MNRNTYTKHAAAAEALYQVDVALIAAREALSKFACTVNVPVPVGTWDAMTATSTAIEEAHEGVAAIHEALR